MFVTCANYAVHIRHKLLLTAWRNCGWLCSWWATLSTYTQTHRSTLM